MPPPLPPIATYGQHVAALCLWREARGEGERGMRAVWEVIQNRMNDTQHRWPKRLDLTVLQPAQFSSFNRTEPQDWPVEWNTRDWEAFMVAYRIVSGPPVAPITNGANHYCVDTLHPSWSIGHEPVAHIGHHKFYRL